MTGVAALPVRLGATVMPGSTSGGVIVPVRLDSVPLGGATRSGGGEAASGGAIGTVGLVGSAGWGVCARAGVDAISAARRMVRFIVPVSGCFRLNAPAGNSFPWLLWAPTAPGLLGADGAGGRYRIDAAGRA